MRKRSFSALAGTFEETVPDDRQFVTALNRGLEVLRAFRPEDQAGLSNRELSERTGLPNSTLSRLTYTLMHSGYLIYDQATGRYRMGAPVLSLGYACLSGQPFRTMAQTYMQDLANAAGEGVQLALGARVDFTLIYLATAHTKSVVALQLDVGTRVSLARSAMGRAYIAGTDVQERTEILDAMRAHHSPQDFAMREAGLRQAFEDYATLGFCCNFGETIPSVNFVAVPLRGSHRNGRTLSFGLGGPATHVSAERLVDDLGPQLVELVETLSLAAT